MKKPERSSWKLDTLLVHSTEQDHVTEATGMPTVQPIYASTTYLHRDTEALDHALGGALPSGEQAYAYARQGNPNAHALENILCQAEAGTGAVVFGSGMAAIHAALLAAGLTPGSKILAAQDLYGTTITLLRKILMPGGVEVVLCDLYGTDAAARIEEEQPDVVYVETLSNPLVKLIDLDTISAAASKVGAVSIVDSTFTTPYLVRPIEHGFDLVVHSATKYMGGHGDSTAGVVISAKNALQVARFLHRHPTVECVHYPGLPGHPQHELASHLLEHGRFGGLLAFELKEQSRAAAFCFMDNLQLCLRAATLGDVYSQVSYPPIASHRNLTESERQNMGITDGCIRLSIGFFIE